MPGGSVPADLANRLDILVHLGATGDLADAYLLRRFLGSEDAASRAAFAALVDRHGPMVLRACRQILDNTQDAQDAFQATFLILARKARSVRNADSVAGWLHGVARRVATRARSDEAARKSHERRSVTLKAKSSDASTAVGPEAWPELHEEVARLPNRYREPVVLCYLEGLSAEAAALRIGCPRGTVLSRLSRARDRLRAQLSRRGVVPPAVLVAVGVTSQAQALPASLLREAVRSSLEFASGRAMATSAAAKLAKGVLFAMMLSKLKIAVVAVAGLLLTLGSVPTVARSVPLGLRPKPGGVVRPRVELAGPTQLPPEEVARRRRDDVLKRLKVEVAKLGGDVREDGASVILERTKTDDDDLGRLAPLLKDLPQLRRLWLDHSLVTDAGLIHVRDLTTLTWLYLENTDVSDAGLIHLKGLTNLVGLSLQNTAVGDEGMKVVGALSKLEWLSLGNTQVGDEGLKRLAGLNRLEVLTLENTAITDAGMVALEGLTRLRYLHLDNTRVTDKGLASIKGLVKLERLYLCDTDVTDAGLVNLEPLKELNYLQLHNTLDGELNQIRTTVKVSDAGLVHLRGLTKLQDGGLFLCNTSVTEAGVATLQEALPQMKTWDVGPQRLLGNLSKNYREPRGSKPRGS